MPTPRRKQPSEPKPAKPWANRRFSKAERQLLDHPPTPRTWVCKRKRKQEGALTECGMVNSGQQRKCVLCASPRPSKPKLLWPLYLAACKKAGIQPKGAE